MAAAATTTTNPAPSAAMGATPEAKHPQATADQTHHHHYTAPPIPSTVRESLVSWLSHQHSARATAHAELHLYQSATPYFQGATLDNAPNPPASIGGRGGIAEIWQCVDSESRRRHDEQQDQEKRSRVDAGGAPSTHRQAVGTASSSSSSSSLSSSKSLRPHERATVGTRLNAADGKVGCVRLVDIGPGRISSGFDEGKEDDDAGVGGAQPPPTSSSRRSPSSSSGGVASGLWGLLSRNVGAKAKPRYLNMLEIGTPHPVDGEEKVVLLHGYGAGTAFFFQNLTSLASHPNSRLYALDWLGMGRSSRPTFHLPSSSLRTTASRVHTAESFFVESLEEWRRVMEVESMTLVGHSLGGYLSVAYALRYPERVARLVLVSPAGVPPGPDQMEEPTADSDAATAVKGGDDDDDDHAAAPQSTFRAKNADKVTRIDSRSSDGHGHGGGGGGNDVSTELRQAQTDVAPASALQAKSDAREVEAQMARPAAGSDGAEAGKPSTSDKKTTATKTSSQGGSGAGAEGEGEGRAQPPRIGKRTRSVFTYLWEKNFSPFGLLRSSLFFGPYLAGRYTSRRFGSLDDDKLRALHAYCVGIFLARGSGEYCLAHLLAPGAHARLPLVERVAPLRMPVSFLYGAHDWMDVEGGREAVRRLRRAGNTRGSCFVLPHAGHHLYLDNPTAFDRLLRRVLAGKADDQPPPSP